MVYSQGVRSFDEEVVLEVFDVASSAELQVSLDSLAVFAYGDSMDVGCFYSLDNVSEPPVVLDGGESTFSFPLVDGTQNVEASTKFGSSMSLRQTVKLDGHIGSISYPLKPGKTQLIVTATRGYDQDRGSSFSLDLPSNQNTFPLVVLPQSMQASGSGVEFERGDEQEDLNVYGVDPSGIGGKLMLDLSGEPAESRVPEAEQEITAHGDIQSVPNSLDRWRWHIVGSIILILAAMAIWGYSRS